MSPASLSPVAGEVSLLVEVWSDLACPWCYVAKRHLEDAVAAFEHPGQVQVIHRSFRLDAASAGAQGAAEQRAVAAAAPTLTFDFGRLAPADTLDAHRLSHLALDQGGPALQAALLERLFSAHFAEGRRLDDPPALQRLGAEAGLDERRLAAVLAQDNYADAVAQDQRRAAELGVTGVPFTLVNGGSRATGALSVEGFLELLHEAWHALAVSEP